MLRAVGAARRRGDGSHRGVPVRDLRSERRVRGDGDRRFPQRARVRTHPEPVRPVQRRDQVRRVPAAGRRARRRPRRDRALRARGPRRPWLMGARARRGPREGSELHAPHAGTARAGALALPDRRARQDGNASDRGAVRAAGRDEARFAGALLRARRRCGRLRAEPRRRAGARRRRGRGWGREGHRRARRDLRLHRGAATRARGGDRFPGLRRGGRRRDEPGRGGTAGALDEAGAGRRSRLVGGGRARPITARSRPRCGSGTGATTCPRSSHPGPMPRSGWSSARRSDRWRRGRASWSTTGTGSSAAAGSWTRSAEPGAFATPTIIVG